MSLCFVALTAGGVGGEAAVRRRLRGNFGISSRRSRCLMEEGEDRGVRWKSVKFYLFHAFRGHWFFDSAEYSSRRNGEFRGKFGG